MKTTIVSCLLALAAVSYSTQAQDVQKKGTSNTNNGSAAKNRDNSVSKHGGGSAGKTSTGVTSEGVHMGGTQMKPNTKSIYDRPHKKSSSATVSTTPKSVSS